ncbi:unnamed protein product [Amoebophrya sp. A25]|nr:unnamed protein product [Amoebophrya sp. A25]|eukprot:GSA25T00016258001.1
MQMLYMRYPRIADHARRAETSKNERTERGAILLRPHQGLSTGPPSHLLPRGSSCNGLHCRSDKYLDTVDFLSRYLGLLHYSAQSCSPPKTGRMSKWCKTPDPTDDSAILPSSREHGCLLACLKKELIRGKLVGSHCFCLLQVTSFCARSFAALHVSKAKADAKKI